ncbi:hypothetical protein [Paracidovorax anthurii]|uniref:Uncharacterized protein n=1 Tax=Paracidovorax anthurii TaxID=78229 RepID=A0A328Z7P6_9BURK|nr:hypothetical protein [Paracidovorax anthurii]RAR80712.1 hypothetical protein AX018_102270 [Paracidovorax anthurii]
MHDNLRQMRKTLAWSIPLTLWMGLGALWMISHDLLPTIQRLRDLAPMVRITPVSVVYPFIVVICFVGSLAAILNAIPWGKAIHRLLGRALTWTTAAALVVLLSALVTARPLQNHFLPQWGYSRCDVLQGQPTLWFSDWVRNPAWCVQGQSREWVDAQARETGVPAGRQP